MFNTIAFVKNRLFLKVILPYMFSHVEFNISSPCSQNNKNELHLFNREKMMRENLHVIKLNYHMYVHSKCSNAYTRQLIIYIK